MKTLPVVTVAIPSLNQGIFLDAALRSLFSQSVDAEVIVFDGGSTDDSVAIIESWREKLAGFHSGPDGGQAEAINEAIKRGRAPLVCWLNADDLYLPGGLAALVEAMTADSSTDVVYGNCRMIDALGRSIGRVRSRPLTFNTLSRGSPIPQAATLFRRDAWEKVGGLDESLHYALDYDLWWRLYRNGARFKRIGQEVAALRIHDGAKSVAFARRQYAEAETVVRRYANSLPLIWRLRQPFSVGARSGSRPLSYLARFWRTWTRW
jgi:glycosyltransferase involved in cell wall biosynthesis